MLKASDGVCSLNCSEMRSAWEEWLIHLRTVLLPRGTWAGWRQGRKKPHEVNKKCKVWLLGRNKAPRRAGGHPAGKICRKGSGDPGGHQLDVSQWCALVKRRLMAYSAALGKDASMSSKVIPPIYSALMRPHLVYCVRSWALQYRKHIEKL